MIWKVVDSRISQRQMGILWNLILSKNLAIARTPFFQWSQNYSQKFANMLLWTSSLLNHPFPMFEWLKRWSVADKIHRKWSFPVAGSRKPSSADIKEEEEREEESKQDKIVGTNGAEENFKLEFQLLAEASLGGWRQRFFFFKSAQIPRKRLHVIFFGSAESTVLKSFESLVALLLFKRCNEILLLSNSI